MRKELSKRNASWQRYANVGGSAREDAVNKILETYLMDNPNYVVTSKPRDLAHIYDGKWGIVPELGIRYIPTNKIAFLECKRQGNNGNAHERLCKYLTPGILSRSTPIAGFYNPFFFILMDGLAKDPKKRLEVSIWFDQDGFRDRYLLWEDKEIKTLIAWFNSNIRRCLE